MLKLDNYDGGKVMATVKTILVILQIIVTVGLIATVLLQEGSSYGLSGSIAGGADTFFGKNKGRTLDGLLKTVTKVLAVLFIVLSLVLTYLYK